MAEDSNELCASLRIIADTVETNGGWHIAAIKVRAAAEEIARLQEELRIADRRSERIGQIAASRTAEAWAEERERLRAVALAAKALVSQCADRGYHCETPEHKLCKLESALEAAGYGMSEEEFERGVTDEARSDSP